MLVGHLNSRYQMTGGRLFLQTVKTPPPPSTTYMANSHEYIISQCPTDNPHTLTLYQYLKGPLQKTIYIYTFN